MTDDDGALLRAQALASPSRRAIHRYIGDATAPVTVAALAGTTGLHHTAVRQHLAKLRLAGLVSEQVLPPSGRGRPKLAYTTNATNATNDRTARYLGLAKMLAEAVRTGRSARETGHAIGMRSDPGNDDPVTALVDETRRMGFDPRVSKHSDGTTDIVLTTCPFAELAELDPFTICELHLGLAEGLATAVGGLMVDHLSVQSPHAGECRLSVRRTEVTINHGAVSVTPPET